MIIIDKNKVRRFKDQRFYADCGMVIVVDEQTGEQTETSPMLMRGRAQALIKEAVSMRKRPGHKRDEVLALAKAGGELLEVVREAEAQGEPLTRVVAAQNRELKKAYLATRKQVDTSGLIIPGDLS